MPEYTLGLFANMYPAFDGDYKGIFIRQMVTDFESLGVVVKKAVKTSHSTAGYIPFYFDSLCLSRDRGLDLIQAEYIPHSSLIPYLFGRRDIPLVLKFHGDDARIYPFSNPLNRHITRAMLKRAAYVITASEEMQKPLLAHGLDPDRCATVHTGVDTRFFTTGSREEARRLLGLSMEKTTFLFVGRLHPWKGIYEILEAARRCPNLDFVFVGPGVVPDHPQNCRFTGQLPPSVVRRWLTAADCFLLPTYTEAVPAAVMEAFACGIPAITSDAGGCPEIVEEGKNGLMVPARNAVALTSAIQWMTDNPSERPRMGIEARKTVCERYDHTILIKKLMTIHQDLITR
ncbi:glycosyltransferase family 4 protein [Methanoregula formicica]|uniref:Glycosyltransferase n=1 Tax=Methanoregula formicica (strain DSM 22288 / NBRC 105244 / SMSP) TaxID=593750 RepID=L0HG93_METFS|nr:glycosyltransferase family 4 protein [Methanoregula formicica]AGB02338.1 glycosyltransferase [Methanoregula formicica SMSP]